MITWSSFAQKQELHHADSLFSVGNYQAAMKIYTKQTQPEASVYFKMAQAQEARGNYQAAKRYYEQTLTANQGFVIAAARYGKLLYRTQDYYAADSLFAKLTSRYPDNPDFYLQRGKAKLKLNDSTAIRQFESALKLDSLHLRALYQVARHRMRKKAYQQADSIGQRSLSVYPENVQMLHLLAQNAYRMRDYPKAIEYFKKVIGLNQQTEFVYEKLGRSYYQLQKYEQAIEAFKEVISINPENAMVHLLIGKLYNYVERFEEAEKHLLYALLLSDLPLDEHYQSLGLTYKFKENYPEAIRYFKMAVKENPKKMRSQYELAVAADNYYKDYQMRINYYQLFIDKFTGKPKSAGMIRLAKKRLQDLQREQHMRQEE